MFKYFLFISLIFVQTSIAKTFTLDELYQKSLQNFEEIEIQSQSIKLRKAERSELVGALLPQVSLNSELEYQSERRGFSGFDNSIDSYQDQTSLEFSQAVFHGGREYFALSRAKQNINKESKVYLNIKNQLFLNLSYSFYTALAYQHEDKILTEINSLLDQQILEIKNRTQIGKSRNSELILAQSKKNQFLGESSIIRSRLKATLDDISYLTKIDTQINLKDAYAFEKILMTFGKINNRPDIQMAQHDLEIAKKDKSIAYSYFLPDVDIEANYLAIKPDGFRSSEWTVTGELSLPLFTGTSRIHKVNQSKANYIQKKLKLNQTERQAKYEIEKKYFLIQGLINEKNHLESASQLAYQAYEMEKENYLRNLVSQLDLLNVLENYLQTKRKVIQSEKNIKLAYINYKIATGENK